METYRYTKIVKAKPMTRHEAEMVLGKEIINLFHGENGFLVEYLDTKQQKWVPETLFAPFAKPYATPEDKLEYIINELEYAKAWVNEIKKDYMQLRNIRSVAFTTKKHIEATITGITKIIRE